MSTQINVIVDNGGLSAKAKQQTQANRWSKLEGDNRQKVQATGTQQRDANRAQQGIGPDGRLLYGTPPAQLLRRDEPAAWRTGRTFPVGHGWLLYLGEDTPTSQAYKDKYRVYSGDLSNYLEFTVERAKPPQPTLKWGLQSHNTTIDYDFTNAEWQSGYQVSPSDPLLIHGFGYLKNKNQYNPIARSHFLGLEKVVSHLRNYSTSPVSRVVSYDPLIEQNAQWWATNPQIQGITDKYITRIRRKSLADSHQLVLPVGKDTMIVIITSSTYESAHYFGQRTRRLCGASSDNLTFVKDGGDWFRTNEDLYDPDEPIFGGAVVFWYETYRYGGYREKEEVIDSFDETHTNERLVTKCFLVSRSMVKEISAPGALSTALAQRYPFTETFPAYPKSIAGLTDAQRMLYYGSTTLNQQWIDQYWVPEEQAYSYWPSMSGIITSVQYPSYSQQILTYDFNSYTPPAPPSNELQSSSYGFDYLDYTRPPSLPAYKDEYTPGVFTLLGFENTVLPPATIDTSYYSTGSGLNAAWLFDYRYAVGIPENQPSEGVKLFANLAPKISVAGSALSALDATNGWPTLFRVWDWGNPSYCRQKLISLGFTEADLTP